VLSRPSAAEGGARARLYRLATSQQHKLSHAPDAERTERPRMACSASDFPPHA
jgi:hypothetical protein